MKLLNLSRTGCRTVRDEVLSRAVHPEAPPLSGDAVRHLEACGGCADFARAWPVVSDLGMKWRASDPPPGLALRTIEKLGPLWERERPITRQEVRLLWTSGLGMLGSAAAAALVIVDRAFPVSSSIQVETLFRFGIKVGLLQLAGAGLVSLVLLVARAARSSKPHYRPPTDSHWGP
jgi:hypothetical protein